MFVFMIICACTPSFWVHAQIISTVAGSGDWFGIGNGAFSGDSGQATDAQFFQPVSIAIDNVGNIYIADEYNFRIRKINTDGIINTIAGTGVSGYRGDDSLAINAKFCDLGYIKYYNNNLYVPDVCNNRIRKINLTTGIITTVVGIGSSFCSRDTGLATNCFINYPFSVTFDNVGNLFLSDACNYVDKVNELGLMSRFAGSDSMDSYGGDGGQATNARFNHPVDIAFDPEGNLYISDLVSSTIRKIDTYGIITKYAGTDTVYGYTGDNGAATLSQLNFPEGIISDGEGNIFFSDENNNVIRKIDHETKIITTIAGNGTVGYSGDGFAATNAQLFHPGGLAFDAAGNLYIADWLNNRIRKVTNVGVPLRAKSVERRAEAVVEVYPNPATTTLNVAGAAGCEVGVYDMVGRSVFMGFSAGDKLVIDVGKLAKGVYFVEVVDGGTGEKVVKKLLKE